jgi:hypothetical protein
LKITQLRLLAAQAEHARNETLLFNDELIQKRAIADAITNQVKPLEHLKK